MKNINAKIDPLNYDDWKKISYLLIRKKNPVLWIGFIGAILIGLTCLLILSVIWLSNETMEISFLVIISIFSLIFALEIDRRIRANSRRAVDQNEEVQNFIVNELGFSKQDSHENNFSKWTDSKQAIISKNIILLLDDGCMVIFLSKNYSLEDFELILFWVKEKIPVI